MKKWLSALCICCRVGLSGQFVMLWQVIRSGIGANRGVPHPSVSFPVPFRDARITHLMKGTNMEAISDFVGTVNGIVWGVPMLVLILVPAFSDGWSAVLLDHEVPFGFPCCGKAGFPVRTPVISPLQRTDDVAFGDHRHRQYCRCCPAIFGGPGAVFWMWMTALVGIIPNMPRRSVLSASAKPMRTAILSAGRCITSRTA